MIVAVLLGCILAGFVGIVGSKEYSPIKIYQKQKTLYAFSETWYQLPFHSCVRVSVFLFFSLIRWNAQKMFILIWQRSLNDRKSNIKSEIFGCYSHKMFDPQRDMQINYDMIEQDDPKRFETIRDNSNDDRQHHVRTHLNKQLIFSLMWTVFLLFSFRQFLLFLFKIIWSNVKSRSPSQS